ncbi:MAG: ribosome-associated translation inhibitor RaiA [Clostridia bacterium]|nr:ribosome-associated translation inhibitor RaiA [Clostridia bacterium]
MKIKVVERKVTINDKTREKLENKLVKFDKLLGESAEAVATFNTQKDKIFLEISIRSDDMIIRAESSDADAKIAIDKIIDVLEGQFRKYKTKLSRKIKTFAPDAYFNEPSSVEEETEFKVVKSKKFFMKPMSVDEAILQMNLLGHEFFVFTNSETEKVNIVYKRKDLNYGLIETD